MRKICQLSRAVIPDRHLVGLPSTSSGQEKAQPTLEASFKGALGRRAVMDNRSISQEVVMIVKEYLSGSTGNHKRKSESFLELAGTWQDERSAEEIILDIGK
jgi:hypothetical protein